MQASDPATAAVITQQLTKRYRRRDPPAIADIDLVVPRGSCFGLLGPNGAGKSTLVKTLLSIVHPTYGQARLLGQDFRNPESRRRVGYLPEGHRFPGYLTGRNACLYFGHLGGLHGPALARQVAQKLELVGMTERADEKIARYSKGMKQRIGLAQALLGDPELVFLDEPTDGVDPVGRQEIREVILAARRAGATIFINSHLLGEIEQICDRIAIQVRGRVIRAGTLSEVIDSLGTTGTLEVVFRTGALSDGTWRTLAQEGARRDEATGQLVLTLPDEDAIPGAIDRLRAAQVAIYQITPHRLNLEEAFLQLVRVQAPPGAGPGPDFGSTVPVAAHGTPRTEEHP